MTETVQATPVILSRDRWLVMFLFFCLSVVVAGGDEEAEALIPVIIALVVSATSLYLQAVLSTIDEEDEDVIWVNGQVLGHPRGPNKECPGTWWYQLVQVVWRDDPYSDEFRENFGMERETFQFVLGLLYHVLEKTAPNAIPPDTRLAIFLYFVVNGCSLRILRNLFGCGRSTASNIILEVAWAIVTLLKPRFIRLPTTPEELEEKARGFANHTVGGRERGLPNCCGSIDGTHIRINGRVDSAGQDMNYKGFFSLVLMATVDYQRRFIDIDVGMSGSNADPWVHESSWLGISLKDGSALAHRWASQLVLGDQHIPYYLIGDDAFPLSPWLLKAFGIKEIGPETIRKRSFDFRLSSCRVYASEDAFGMFKNRFRMMLDRRVDLEREVAVYVVGACCVLHNICIECGDGVDATSRAEGEEVVFADVENTEAARSRLATRIRDSLKDNLPIILHE
eukprot:Lithocolla_globosa_v1_NODE_1638_length_2431_cov_23.401936.p1 type:complete len:452 gc:universal NODE_1638_length_2431_cov_23.401936:1408-53(-)